MGLAEIKYQKFMILPLSDLVCGNSKMIEKNIIHLVVSISSMSWLKEQSYKYLDY